MKLDELRDLLGQPDELSKKAFPAMQCLAHAASEDCYGTKTQEYVLRALEHRNVLGESATILDALVREFGLFPYLDPERLSPADLLAYEFHKPPPNKHLDVVFHRPQAHVYRALADHQSVVLSAPTSFGKSLLVDAILASNIYDNILVIVPTLALIDETRRRLAKFSDDYVLVTHPMQSPGSRNVFVMTQERASILDLSDVDFFVIDEFYKLSPNNPNDHRSAILNQVFYELATAKKPFYLLGPSILRITDALPARVDCKFLHEPYQTVASVTHKVDDGGDPLAALTSLRKKLTGPTLIFCQSPTKTAKVADLLIQHTAAKPSSQIRAAVKWIASNYHPAWHFAQALSSGIGVHHGRIPRSLAQFVVRCFDEEELETLICTSSMIEGVNTKAKNIVVLDNKINRSKYDYFTFNNIRGRAGRMFRHFVGHVYLFHESPSPELPFVDIPAFSQSDEASDSLLVQLKDEDLTNSSRDRLKPVWSQQILSLSTIKANAGVDPQAQIQLATTIANTPNMHSLLQWQWMPNMGQLKYICRLIWDHFNGAKLGNGSARSPEHLAFLVNRLRSKPTTKELIDDRIEWKPDPDEAVTLVLDFQRLWATFHFPRLLRAIELIQKEVLQAAGQEPGNFGTFASSVENLFREPALIALDEYGLPLEIAEKLERHLVPKDGLDAVLKRLRELDPSRLPLSGFEQDIVKHVVSGLGGRRPPPPPTAGESQSLASS